ncbi:hypothetical protein [Bacillus sp. FJAT-28004]|uniref:hypothetical protein n=1 Tax=Bacillus sp. FJAT-28004 TaxID=1679165 RepID=UPI0006B5064A|nr:hypothetical protein [Bacillus sp. FJAT-28004]
MENVQQANVQERALENMGLLDLTGVKAEDLADVTSIRNNGIIIAPESLSSALNRIPQQNNGCVCLIPNTAGKVKILSGQVSLGGEFFANSNGAPEDIAVIAGQAVITSPVEKIGFQDIILAGQLILPKGSDVVLGSAISRMLGQVVYYSNTSNVRLFLGDDTFSNSFFDFIEEKMCMVLIGSFEIADDVQIESIKNKVSEIVLVGDLTASKAVVPLLQYLAISKTGDINIRDDA